MAKRELMNPIFNLLLAVLLLLSINMFQWQVATCDPACQMESTRTRTRKLMQDYSGYVPSPSDYDYNDFYRRQGDVPSPGVGH
ncbi:hypothetical protein PTKIN_Ptkin16aG0002700 [Pterospermum kingtungense]